MIPAFVDVAGSPWPLLPAGIHVATLLEVEAYFATNPKRRRQFSGLIAALENLQQAGCRRVFLDGSFVTGKPHPSDFDACWDPTGVNLAQIDPVLLTFNDKRAAQKAKYYGEFFPSTVPANPAGAVFVDYFQVDRFTGAPKGIVSIDLVVDAMLKLTVKS